MSGMSENVSNMHSGKSYWRSLQELADTDEFREQLENEFPGGIDAPVSGMSRRRFLQVMSASIAMVSLAGCRWPEEKIMPYAHRAPGVDPGVTRKFATTMELGPVPTALLATSYDGRPIKIDGNPDFKLSGGATSAFAQASVLDLYDPNRSTALIKRDGGQVSNPTWDEFLAEAKSLKKGIKKTAFLTEVTSSPSVWYTMGRLAGKGARVYTWEAVCRVNEVMGAVQAFGTPAKTQLDLTQAQIIVDFDANMMQDHPTALRNARQFAKGRRPESGHMNRLYCYENNFSVTGGQADHRFPTAAGDVGAAVWALAAELVLGEGLPLPEGAGFNRGDLNSWRHHKAAGEHVSALAKDLMANRGHSLLLAGMRQPAEVHAMVYTLNAALGNSGKSISYLPMQMPEFKNISDLVNDLNSGSIETLVMLGGNPVYNAPADLNFADAMMKAKNRIHLADSDNATSQKCTWHLPKAHYLESWGDAVAWDGTYMAVQPLIAPLFGGKTNTEVLSAFNSRKPKSSFDKTRSSFSVMTGGSPRTPNNNPEFEKRWSRFIHDGHLSMPQMMEVSALPLIGQDIVPPARGHALSKDNLEISFALDQSVYDGRFANNAWLQELPDFMTKLTWDNAAMVSPATADELGIKQGDLVNMEYGGTSMEAAVYVMPGQARYSITANLGYGNEESGPIAKGAGFDFHKLRTWKNLDTGQGLKISPTGKSYALATTQDHHAIDDAGAQEIQKRVPALVRQGTVDDYNNHPEFVDHLGLHHPPLKSLWKEHEYTGYKWGMAIDLNVCNGCNACILGCQSENNVAVVGKDEVARGREMSWLRLDRYFLGDMENPECTQQPVGCVQCEMAPCEQVCPVAATMHTDEGLNAMVYNRCVGTRYCSNNCPYKVRRFNWFNNYEEMTEVERLVLNPDVTVRSRGVMEKCSYCVQRIEGARVTARVEGRKIQDGDITPACAETCPVDAITFGDLNDQHSQVSKLREDSRSYDLLEYLNIKPRTFYMARIRNPNPAIAPASHDGGHGNEKNEGHATEHGGAHG
ncbi:MAG: TAT-variant-translocated molybdopterin oxidoreductase [bacterium]|nr:TAT-variant-translocated molybdopterin oxidoreductase [bacterium]